MKRQLASCALLLLLMPLVGCGQEHEVKTNSPAQSQADALAAKMAKGEIGKVEILKIPARIFTQDSNHTRDARKAVSLQADDPGYTRWGASAETR